MTDLETRLQAALGDTYRLDEELGGGGMSRVFLADEVKLGRRVVIKVLPPEMGAGVNVERFEREIQLAARLQHPHIVPLLTAGAEGDLLWYVMPFIQGESLRAKLGREGELPVREAVRILREVVDALSYAHGEGLVHRDIKPDNILLSGKHALVTDFGVAKAVSASSGGSSLTSLGVALGTPAYMAPEQATADPNVDHRADIYAVGVVGYEMLCGRLPFAAASPQAMLAAHVTQDPEPVTAHRGAVPPALAEVIMRCLAKNRADRWQRADELLGLLEEAVTPSGGTTPTGTQPVISSGTEAALQAHRPARVAALFGIGAALVLALVFGLVRVIGLPDWVFLAAVGLLAAGLPIILLTGHQERERIRAGTTGVHPTPAGLRKLFTWRRALAGGTLAFAGLGVLTVGFMAMRQLGIGPVGTLVASGALDANSRIVLADFANRTTDSTLATSVTDALRVDLALSRVVRLVDPSAVNEARRRMERGAGLLTADLARELAQREGYAAVVQGEIGPVGTGYVLSASLVRPDGEVLTAVRETADDDGELIPAIERLSVALRERIGESYKALRASPPLERVTTGSFDALRKYSQAIRAEDEGDLQQATALLEEAVALDTAFAMAYRKLAVIIGNNFGSFERELEAARLAFAHRDRLPAVERYLTEANYYSRNEHDPTRVIAAYRSVLEIDPEEITALNNLAAELNAQRRYAEAEPLARRALAAGESWTFHANLALALSGQGRWEAADSALEAFAVASSDNPHALRLRATLAGSRHNFQRADSLFGVLAQEHPGPAWQRLAHFSRAALAQSRGQLAASDRFFRDFLAVARDEGLPGAVLFGHVQLAGNELLFRQRPEAALAALEEGLSAQPLASMPAVDRPYPALATGFARAGRPARARELLREWETAVPEVLREANPNRHRATAEIARAEGRHREALEHYRDYFTESDCPCGLFEMGEMFDRMDQPDSARAYYEASITTPQLFRMYEERSYLAVAYKRLGELAEGAGDRRKAVEYYGRFVDLWENADAELQPVVRDVRGRIARLTIEQ